MAILVPMTIVCKLLLVERVSLPVVVVAVGVVLPEMIVESTPAVDAWDCVLVIALTAFDVSEIDVTVVGADAVDDVESGAVLVSDDVCAD